MRLIKDLGIIDFGTYKKRVGIYECPLCKKHFKARSNNVNNGKSTKCTKCANKKHGDSNISLYRVWTGIKYRTSKDITRNKEYIGRGISICEEWKHDYNIFKEWSLENGYKDGLSIDRINNNGNYEPSNCRWVENYIQSENTRLISRRNTSGYRGVSWDKKNKRWVSQIRHNGKHYFLGRFKEIKNAVSAYNNFIISNNTFHPLNDDNDNI